MYTFAIWFSEKQELYFFSFIWTKRVSTKTYDPGCELVMMHGLCDGSQLKLRVLFSLNQKLKKNSKILRRIESCGICMEH
jgi:hypothetical protein